MTAARDPYSILGLEAGASPAEIKRAYRRLAKVLHPDFAGEQSLPAFLAVQEAYERLTGTRVRTVRQPGGGAPPPSASRGPSGFREPWRADPERARAAREQARARRGGPGAGPADGGPSASAGSSRAGPPGSGAGGSRARGERTAGGPRAGGRDDHASGGQAGPRPGGPASADASADADGADGAGGAGDGGSSGTAGRRAGGSRAGATRRRRPTRKATMGSTSYDEARDTADPRWAGASWYGPTSGEYWIVNPREYADPRKHGPGYSSRVRSGGEVHAPDAAEPESHREARPEARPDAGPAAGPEAGRKAAMPADAQPETAGPSVATSSRERSMPPKATVPGAGSSPLGFDLDALLRTGTADPLRRIGLVLLAWAPIGIATAGVIGDVTGCATYSTACDGTDPFLPWVAQAVIIGVLLVVAPLARVLAAGAIATVVGLVPATALVIAAGGARSTLAGSVLGGTLALAWLAGVAWATWRMLVRRGGEPS